jgi:hypothetical protein
MFCNVGATCSCYMMDLDLRMVLFPISASDKVQRSRQVFRVTGRRQVFARWPTSTMGTVKSVPITVAGPNTPWFSEDRGLD